MDSYFRNNTQKKISVIIRAAYSLTQQCLKLLLEDDRDLTVTDVVATDAQLIDKVSRNKPDVVFINLTDDESQNVTVLTDLFKVAPQTKVLILTSPDSTLDQTAALKLGVTGIVSANRSPRVLIRAIKQVSEGGVWLNQKIIAQLLDNNNGLDNEKAKRNGFFKDNDLTSRELEVIEMIAQGMNNKDISNKLFISEATVRHHLSSIYSKLNVDDRLNLAIYAFQNGIAQSQSASA